MLGTTLIRPGLQSKLSSLTVCNSKNGMGFGPSWALMRPCCETILESSWGSLGPSWDYLVAFLGLSWQPPSSDQDPRANCQAWRFAILRVACALGRLGPSWGHLGQPSWSPLEALLGPSCGLFGPILATTLIELGLQSNLSSLIVCNSKNGMRFGPSWVLVRPCWETILDHLGTVYLVVFLGLSWQPSSSDQDSRANCQVWRFAILRYQHCNNRLKVHHGHWYQEPSARRISQYSIRSDKWTHGLLKMWQSMYVCVWFFLLHPDSLIILHHPSNISRISPVGTHRWRPLTAFDGSTLAMLFIHVVKVIALFPSGAHTLDDTRNTHDMQ